ncbi:MAG: class II aldolase/adducin family protein [Halodesulfurarchaeum sp.]|nr:class II aldolase/adducin family protein [Halodesulfurarchaeum sp.]
MSDSDPDRAAPHSAAELRAAVVSGLPDLAELTPGRTGNLSVRSGATIAVTPSGVPYSEIEPSDVPLLTIDGDRQAGALEPSSETPMHLGIYRSLAVGSIVHVHSPWATTLAVLGEELPPVHYLLAAAGGTVPVAPYAPFGSTELAGNAVTAMEAAGTTACLLANHGLIAGGTDIDDALETAIAVESTAQMFLQAASVGDPVELTDREMEEAMKRFETYGQSESTPQHGTDVE